MKFLDLEAQYQSIKQDVDRAITDVIYSSGFIMGKQVQELEEQIAAYIGTKYAIGLNSGSDALTASLIALGIGRGDEVIVPSFTYIATAEAVSIVGAEVVFVDIDPDTFNIDPGEVKKAVTPKTKAIIPVHLYGQPADMDTIMAIAKEHNLFVVEDAAQAIGAEWDGKKVGSFGDTGCLSFFPTKNLGAYGDGGMVTTNNKSVADFLRKWRIHGQPKKYYTEFVGASSRLDTLQAAILLAKLPHLDAWTEARRNIATHYNEALATASVTVPYVAPKATHVYHQYTIKVRDRDALKNHLAGAGIPTMVYYPLPLHQQKAYLNDSVGDTLTISQQLSETVLSLPIYPELVPDEVKRTAGEITSFNEGKAI